MWLLAGSCSIIDAVMIMLMSNYQCFLMIFLAASKERLCGYWLKGEIAGHEERLCVVIRGCQTWIEEVWCDKGLQDLNRGGDISRERVTKRESEWLEGSPVRYAKFESIRYFIDIDILQNCLIDIDIDIFQNHHIDIDIDIFQNHLINIDIDIDIFGIALSISIFLELPYQYRYRYRYFQLLHIDIDIDIDIFQKCRYIDNRYFISIF